MKVSTSPTLIFVLIWEVVFLIAAFLLSKFYLLSLALLPTAAYEAIRTEGVKNTKPLSLLASLLLVFQFLHSTGLFLFPLDITFLTDILPITIPQNTDPFIFLSVIVLIVFSLLLVRYTWGSITKFLAIGLLAGALVQGYLFWPEIEQMLKTTEGQKLLEGQKQEIKENLDYRLKRELFY